MSAGRIPSTIMNLRDTEAKCQVVIRINSRLFVLVVPANLNRADLHSIARNTFGDKFSSQHSIVCAEGSQDRLAEGSAVVESVPRTRGGMTGSSIPQASGKTRDAIRSDIKEMLEVCSEKVQILKIRCSDLVDRVKRDIIRSKSTKRFSLDLSIPNGTSFSNPDMGATPFPTGEISAKLLQQCIAPEKPPIISNQIGRCRGLVNTDIHSS